MNTSRRLLVPLLTGGIISLLVSFAFLGIPGGGASVLARGAHHSPTHHQKKPSVRPECIPPKGLPPATEAIVCSNVAASTAFTLTVSPDCSQLKVADGTPTGAQRNSAGGWPLMSNANGQLNFSVNTQYCPAGNYLFTLTPQTGGSPPISF